MTLIPYETTAPPFVVRRNLLNTTAPPRSGSGAGDAVDLGVTSCQAQVVMTEANRDGIPFVRGRVVDSPIVIALETSADASAWSVAGRFASGLDAGVRRQTFTGLQRYVRVTWSFEAGVSATFAVQADV